jgi:hypothetical protein
MNEKTLRAIYYLAIILIALSISWALVFNTFFKSSQNADITLNVVGIVNVTNSSLISLHYECIKYCEHEATYNAQQTVDCWNQCALLGREGCHN